MLFGTKISKLILKLKEKIEFEALRATGIKCE
jgi:hypothetical protein